VEFQDLLARSVHYEHLVDDTIIHHEERATG
jgi:hypothetical protein